MTITREQIGIFLGFLVLSALILLTTWGTISFIVWDINPGNWSVGARIGAVVVAFLLMILRVVAERLTIVEALPDEEQR